jgi:hypothetical protein
MKILTRIVQVEHLCPAHFYAIPDRPIAAFCKTGYPRPGSHLSRPRCRVAWRPPELRADLAICWGDGPPRNCAAAAAPSMGFCQPPVAWRAVLPPAPADRVAPAICFWPDPAGNRSKTGPAPGVTRHRALWSADFPPERRLSPGSSDCPTGLVRS